MPSDKYSSFEQLFATEVENEDYEITCEPRDSRTVILAPHGGRIEPGTSEIATSIAGHDLGLYKFEGLRKRPHSDLHVTSHKYDEPQAIAIVKDCRLVLAVHGRADKGDTETVWIGGRDVSTGEKVAGELRAHGFLATIQVDELGAQHPNNICNRGLTSSGVQLEIPRTLRNRLLVVSTAMETFSKAVRKAFSAE